MCIGDKTFYCGSCGHRKPVEAKVKRKGKRVVCKNCVITARKVKGD